jgi:hypothetical protein
VLESQLSTAKLVSRENTGAGCYTRFAVQRECSPAIQGERFHSGPETKIQGLQHGMGFILWVQEGYADCLERHSYGESTSGINLETSSFELL